ncbi:clpA-like protein [Fragilaria crotonensis]|nr:clpA-like protein [Fragilaria crotonensis]
MAHRGNSGRRWAAYGSCAPSSAFTGLLDEVEKAHPDVLNILLQVMEDGILTDGKGRTICFKNTILVLTSNTGSKRILELSRMHDGRPEYSQLVVAVKRELEATMKPELLNRIDEIVVFEPLSDEELTLIAAMMVVEITVRAQMERGIDITVTRALTKKVVEEGRKSAGQFGARPMRRAVQRIVEDPVSDAIVQGFLAEDDSAVFDLVENADAFDGSYRCSDEISTLQHCTLISRSQIEILSWRSLMLWLKQTLHQRSSMDLLWSGEVQATPSLQDAITYRVPYINHGSHIR